MAGMVAGGNDTATTALQNLVVAFNSVNKTLQYINGQFTSPTYPSAGPSTVLIYHGRCRVVSVTIVTVGGDLSLYDSSEISIISAATKKVFIDSTAPLGVVPLGVEFTNGVVLVVNAPIEVNVTYSVF